MKKIIVVNNGTLPLPAVRGGAVETLIELLIKENEEKSSYLKFIQYTMRKHWRQQNYILIHLFVL